MDNENIIKIIESNFSNESNFLKNIYNINSCNDGINYLNNNKNIKIYTKVRILSCLYRVFITDDEFTSKDYIEHLYESYLEVFNIKLKKSGIKNVIINNKYNELEDGIFVLIKKNINIIIEE